MTPSTPSPLATFIRERRHELGLTLQQLADRVAMPKSKLHYYESGTHTPKLATLAPLAEALEVAYEDLLALTGGQRPSGLPSFSPYLRAKWGHLSEDAIAEAEEMFAEWERRHAAATEEVDGQPDH